MPSDPEYYEDSEQMNREIMEKIATPSPSVTEELAKKVAELEKAARE